MKKYNKEEISSAMKCEVAGWNWKDEIISDGDNWYVNTPLLLSQVEKNKEADSIIAALEPFRLSKLEWGLLALAQHSGYSVEYPEQDADSWRLSWWREKTIREVEAFLEGKKFRRGNTYNCDVMLSHDVQWYAAGFLTVVHLHIGTDIRAGYTRPFAVKGVSILNKLFLFNRIIKEDYENLE